MSALPIPELQVTEPTDTMEIASTPGGAADDVIDIDLDISPGKDQEGDYLLDDASDVGTNDQQTPTNPVNQDDQVMQEEEDFLIDYDDDDENGMDQDVQQDVQFRDASHDEEVEDAPAPDTVETEEAPSNPQDQEVDVIHFDDPTEIFVQDFQDGQVDTDIQVQQSSSKEEPFLDHQTENDQSLDQHAHYDQVEGYSVPESTAHTTATNPSDPVNSQVESSQSAYVEADHLQELSTNQDGEALSEQHVHESIGPKAELNEGSNTNQLEQPNTQTKEDDNESELYFDDEIPENSMPSKTDTADASVVPEQSSGDEIKGNSNQDFQDFGHEADQDEPSLAEQQDDKTYDGEEDVDKATAPTSAPEQHQAQQWESTSRSSYNVVIDWAGEQYSLLPDRNTDDDNYFLQDESLVNDSIQKLLGACKTALGESVPIDDIAEFEIPELGLYISEDCPDAPSTSLSEVIDIYVQLHQYNNPFDGDPLCLQLTTRPRFSNRLNALLQAAKDGIHINELTFLQQDSISGDDFAAGEDDAAFDDPDDQQVSAFPEATSVPEESHPSEHQGLETPHGVDIGAEAPEQHVTTESRIQHQDEDQDKYVEEDENYLDIFGDDKDEENTSGEEAVRESEQQHADPHQNSVTEARTSPNPAEEEILEFDEDFEEQSSPATISGDQAAVTENGTTVNGTNHIKSQENPASASEGNHTGNSQPTSMTNFLSFSNSWLDDDDSWLEDISQSPTPKSSKETASTAIDNEDIITFDDDEEEEGQTSLKRSRDAVDDDTAKELEVKRHRSE